MQIIKSQVHFGSPDHILCIQLALAIGSTNLLDEDS